MTLVHPCWTHTAIMDRQALEGAASRPAKFQQKTRESLIAAINVMHVDSS